MAKYKEMNIARMIEVLCSTAKTGLAKYYPEGTVIMPYTTYLDKARQWKLDGVSHRYAAISQIGISRWLKYHPDDKQYLPDLWPRISAEINKITQLGDAALSLWAGVESGGNDCEQFAGLLAQCWERQSRKCNSVELGWIVQACTQALQKQNDLESHVQPLLYEAKNMLVGLFRPNQNLFLRHNRSGFKESFSRRIASFADQVYPILALSNYGLAFDDKQSIEFAAGATEQICRLQGPLGQWWWHYDAIGGKVCEEYPVFSVHQDAMAPMAIMASDRATGQNHLREIELGLRWILGNNELNKNLLLSEAKIIWRNIQKRELPKFSRVLRALLCVGGLELPHRLAGKCFVGFRITRECRPYHLGWILYAWANYDSEN